MLIWLEWINAAKNCQGHKYNSSVGGKAKQIVMHLRAWYFKKKEPNVFVIIFELLIFSPSE